MSKSNASGGLTVPSGLSLAEKVIEHIAVSEAVAEKAASLEKTAAATKTAVAALIPSVVQKMIDCERITPDQREKLAGLLADPVQALTILEKVADHRNAAEVAKLGGGVPATAGVKTASHNPGASLTSPYVGARTTRVKQSSVNLFRMLGINIPEEEMG